MGSNDAPRVLRVTYEFYIPRGAPGNVRTHSRRAAVDAMTGAVKAIAQEQLPLAATVTVHEEWSYRWDTRSKTHHLPRPDTALDGADQNTD